MVIKRFKRWKEWRKYTSYSIFEQILVLFGLMRSYHFEHFTINE